MTSEMKMFASCLPGLEPWLRGELGDLGIDGEELAGGVAFAGGRAELYRANLCSGIATHVLVRLDRFPSRHLAHLRKKADAVAWRDLLGRGQPFAVRASTRQSKLYHSGAVAERVAAAIIDATGAQNVAVPKVGEGGEAVLVLVRVHEDMVTISVDTSGEPLHRRGWRQQVAKAPLREDLARAVVLASEWDPQTTFVDPMMGSGTLAIEAACYARRLPPGRFRSFAFERTALFDRELWQQVRDDAAARRHACAPATIHGSDRDAGAVAAATANAERAGVIADVELRHAPLSSAPVLSGEPAAGERGALVCNPPYGKRIGEGSKLPNLYQALGHRVRTLPPGWRVAVCAADRRLALRTGLPLETAFLTRHGGSVVRLLTCGLDKLTPQPR